MTKYGRLRRSHIVGALVLPTMLITSLSACGTPAKSEAQQAQDALNAGLRAQNQGNLTEAAEDYRKALAHDPTNKYAYYDLGLIDQLTGHSDSAEKNYRAALQIDPNMAAALYNLAIIRTTPAPEEAEQLYRHVIALQPNQAGPHLNLAFVLRSLGRKAEARTEFATAVALDPSLASRVPADMRPLPTPSPTPH